MSAPKKRYGKDAYGAKVKGSKVVLTGALARVILTYRVPGFHLWGAAPESESFLNVRHRHMFHLRVEWAVRHNDRDIEFFDGAWNLQATLGRHFTWKQHGYEFGQQSCEMIAQALAIALVADGRPAPLAVEVWEDGENGARLEWSP